MGINKEKLEEVVSWLNDVELSLSRRLDKGEAEKLKEKTLAIAEVLDNLACTTQILKNVSEIYLRVAYRLRTAVENAVAELKRCVDLVTKQKGIEDCSNERLLELLKLKHDIRLEQVSIAGYATEEQADIVINRAEVVAAVTKEQAVVKQVLDLLSNDAEQKVNIAKSYDILLQVVVKLMRGV